MKKFIIRIILVVSCICILQFIVVSIISVYRNLVPTIDKMIDEEIDKQASKLMRDEIIKQLKEKGAIK